MSGDVSALAAAIGPVPERPPEAADEVQPELVGLEPLFPEAKVGGKVIKAGPGRPAGSRNRRTEEWRRYYEARYRHPIDFWGAVLSMTPEALSAALSCTRLEAVTLQRQAASDLAPYLLERIPQALKAEGVSAGTLVIMQGEQIQALSIGSLVVSPNPGSPQGEKP